MSASSSLVTICATELASGNLNKNPVAATLKAAEGLARMTVCVGQRGVRLARSGNPPGQRKVRCCRSSELVRDGWRAGKRRPLGSVAEVPIHRHRIVGG